MSDAPDPDECLFPPCPRCETPVVRITSSGPHSHAASPCGCWLSLADVRALRG
ncbi:hypothetical protein [Halovivax cerinus]|uniref:Small CPxCG-related zinc finger protein n=1 Tax=Halovivax cerinus TaxID=1487865 RepID=A0ABD5NR20_9EURY|nr:hypothetical protein [Halovivax cerinus]